MECIYQRQIVREPEVEVSSSIGVDNVPDKTVRSNDSDPVINVPVPEDILRNKPRSTNMKQPRTNKTVIEVKGKMTLSVVPDDGSDAKIQVENLTDTTFSLTVQGCVNITFSGENELGIKTNAQETKSCSNCCSSKEKHESSDRDHSQYTKTHRRNNSDYLFVNGERQLSVSNMSAEEDIVETRSVDETSTVFMKSQTSVNDQQNTSCKARQLEDNIDGAHIHQMCTEFSALGKDCVRNKRCNPDGRVNLAVPIRENFKLLLQEIRHLSLCDHLYQNYVIDMDTFQSVYDASRNGRPTNECIRGLLLHLSRGSVNEKALRKSLVESDHTTIIPLLLNGNTSVPHCFV